MANLEKCKFLAWDGTCTIAPKPKWVIAMGDTIVRDSTPNKPSQATVLLEGRYGCAGATGIFPSTRIARQKKCDQYIPRDANSQEIK